MVTGTTKRQIHPFCPPQEDTFWFSDDAMKFYFRLGEG